MIWGREKKPGEPVMVPPGGLERLEAVRRSGAHMVERIHVLVLAKPMDYRQIVRWVRGEPGGVREWGHHGLEAAPEEGEQQTTRL